MSGTISMSFGVPTWAARWLYTKQNTFRPEAIIFYAVLCCIVPVDITQLILMIFGALFHLCMQKTHRQMLSPKLPAVGQNSSAIVRKDRSSTAFSPHRCSGRFGPSSPAQPKISLGISATARPRNRHHTWRAPAAPLPGAALAKSSISAVPTRSKTNVPIAPPMFQSFDWESEVAELLPQIRPTVDSNHAVQHLASMVEWNILGIIPLAKVTGYTSGNFKRGRAFGVAVPEVDIVVDISPDVLIRHAQGCDPDVQASMLDMPKMQKAALRHIVECLTKSGFKFRRSAFRQGEPKVTLIAPAFSGSDGETVPIDLSVNAKIPMYSSTLLTECRRLDARTEELALLVKRWTKDRGICHVAKGFLSPYFWNLLVVYFLQVGVDEEGPLLPPVDGFADGVVKMDTRNWTAHGLTQQRTSVGTLFKEFLYFYDARFDWGNEAVSVRHGRRGPPPLRSSFNTMGVGGWSIADGIFIEDPSDATQNLGSCMNAASLARTREELTRAVAICSRNGSLCELLELWQPHEDCLTEKTP